MTRDMLLLASILMTVGLAAGAIVLLYRRLRAAEQALRTRDELLAVAAHELKTPLTTITGHAVMLQRRLEQQAALSQRDHHTLRVIVGQAKRLNRLIDSLLDLASLQRGQLQLEPSVVDLAALAQRVAADIRLTTARHTITAECSEAPLFVRGDALRLEQVLWNLLQNAIKYSPTGGPIVVQVQRYRQDAQLSVQDQGIGIPEDKQGQLFQRFYRAGNNGAQPIRGVGLGLAVVHDIVRRHGGTVDVTSEEGQGSTFTVHLPLSMQTPEAAMPAHSLLQR